MLEKTCDILIVGGGLGGVAAALAALRLGQQVILTEETDWLGGQLTAQAVPPDEHPWIEFTGCTGSYRRLRTAIRQYYRDWYPLKEEYRQRQLINPGEGVVSALCHEPRVALAVIEGLLAPFRASRQLEVLLRYVPQSVEMDGDRVRAVILRSLADGPTIVCTAPFVLDATELGDLLELGRVEHVTGAESQAQTGELHALSSAPDLLDQQAISWCFAVDYCPGEDHTIPQPEDYTLYHDLQLPGWPGPQLGWRDVYPHTLQARFKSLFEQEATPDGRDSFTFFSFRQIVAAHHYLANGFFQDVTLVNWPAIDYWLGPVVGVSAEEKARHLRGAQQLSLSMLYWMQTEAPRHNGGYGYPELRLRSDLTGTLIGDATGGLAKAAYIREARRIQAEFTVTENHVGVEARRGQLGAETFPDSIGVGSYRIDLHPSTAGRNYIDVSSYPFQVPLGALLPVRVENLLPAGKNLGVTHITNGCYRLHPVEWNIGEAAGALAAFCLEQRLSPRQVRHSPERLADFQTLLVDQLEFVLEWPEYIRTVAR